MGTPFTQWHVILSQNTRSSKLSYGKNPKSLSHLVSKRYWDVTPRWTDRRTDRITIAITCTRYSMLALVRKTVTFPDQVTFALTYLWWEEILKLISITQVESQVKLG